jgi:hypothetical protein
MRQKLYTAVILIAGALSLRGQQVIAPTNEAVGSPRGENYGDYNITNWFEVGYRWHTVDGDVGKYRSDVNYGNGLRLLGSNLTVNSKDGHGRYFDELLLSTQGLGNDPYESSSLRIQKNGLYRYDLSWRQNDYYNPALPIAYGQHFMDTTRRFHDHSLVLFPQSGFKLFAGYSRNAQNGPALSTIQLFDGRGDVFPFFDNVRRLQDEYRLGAELSLFGVKLSFLRGWEHFREDSTDSLNGTSAGDNPTDLITLTNFQRSQPYHGSTGSWRVNLISDRSKLYSINGRFAYAGGRRDFIFDETAVGTDRFGSAQNRQTFVSGNARRPVLAANLTLSLFPGTRLTVVNHSAYNDTRIDGDGVFRQFTDALLDNETVHFQFLGIRTFSNQTDVNFRFSKRAGLYAGYQVSTRKIRSIEQQAFGGVPDQIAAEQDNTLHSGTFGIRLKPVKPLIINLDAEIGRADKPFFPISEKNYHALSGRIQYQYKTLFLSASSRTNYNTNSISLTSHSSHARTYAADASWAPSSWISFEADYNKLHLDTLSGIAYFANGDLLNGRSIYVSNIHAGNFGVRLNPRNRVSFYVGYSRVQDTADNPYASLAAIQNPFGGPLSPITASTLLNGVAAQPAGTNDFYQAYPLSFESPLARLSVRLNERLRWNAGYQYYRYSEKLIDLQNYRAHTAYTSVTWSF